MLRLIAVCALLGLVAACSDDARSTTSPPATHENAKPTESGAFCGAGLPEGVLVYGNESQPGRRLAFDWRGADCAINAHPLDKIYLPDAPLIVPSGARPQVVLTRHALKLTARAWSVDATRATESEPGAVEVGIEVYSGQEYTLAVLDETLELAGLPPGDYLVQVGGDWPEGSTSFAFHVKIEPTP